MQTDPAALIAELRGLCAKATPGPWAYRPYEYDDWGLIRRSETDFGFGPCKPIVAIARETDFDTDLDEHRHNKTDPYEPNGKLIVAAVNNLLDLLDLIEAQAATIARIERNRDMWKGQCERQAEALTTAHDLANRRSGENVNLAATIALAREGLRAIEDGDVPRPLAKSWRADGQRSKLDQCEHGYTMSDDCGSCIEAFARDTLAQMDAK